MNFNIMLVKFIKKTGIFEDMENKFTYGNDDFKWKIDEVDGRSSNRTRYNFTILEQSNKIPRDTGDTVYAQINEMYATSNQRPQLIPGHLYLRGYSEARDNEPGRDYVPGDKLAFAKHVFALMTLSKVIQNKVAGVTETVSSCKKQVIEYMCNSLEISIEDLTLACVCCNEEKKIVFDVESNDINLSIHVCATCKKEVGKCITCGTELYEHLTLYITTKDNKHICMDCMKQTSQSSERVNKWKDYSTKPRPNFFGDTNGRFFGCEIEVEYGSLASDFTIGDTASFLGSQTEHIYFKRDGSLDNGIEVITHPCTIDYHKENTLPVLKMLNQLHYEGRETCGIHIHTSKEVFGSTIMEKAKNMGRVLWLSVLFFDELKQISLRTKYDYCEQNTPPDCSVDYNTEMLKLGTVIEDNGNIMSDDEIAVQYTSTFYRSSSRYKAINLCYNPTVEFRLPQSVLEGNTFMAFLQLWDRMIDISISDIDFKNKSFMDLFMGYGEELDNHIHQTLLIEEVA